MLHYFVRIMYIMEHINTIVSKSSSSHDQVDELITMSQLHAKYDTLIFMVEICQIWSCKYVKRTENIPRKAG